MTDRHGIGRAMEREAINFLHNLGYHGGWQPGRTKFQHQDIFGIFDFLIVSPEGCVEGFQICPSRPCWVHDRVEKIRAWTEFYHVRNLKGFTLSYKKLPDGNIIWTWH